MMLRESRRGDLVIAAPAGLGRIGGLYRELGALGWRVDLHEVGDPPALAWGGRVAGRWPRALGGERLRRAWQRLQRSPWAFERRSRATERAIGAAARDADCVLQVGGMASPAGAAAGVPYVLFLDCTVKLGEGLQHTGVDFRSLRAAERWYAREHALYRDAAWIFTASEWVRRSLVADYGIDPERAVVVGEGCNLPAPRLQREPGPGGDGRTILYVGYEFERKGGPVLLDAFRRVRAAVPDAELVIAGPRRIAHDLPAGACLLGPVPKDELVRLYSRASVFVLPSLFEPFGLVLIEAMEHAVPCVASDLCAISEIVVDGETGLLAPAAHPPALADRIVRLLRDPALARRMGDNGRRRVRERFTWPAVAQRVDRRLATLLDRLAGTAAGVESGFQERETRLHNEPTLPAASAAGKRRTALKTTGFTRTSISTSAGMALALPGGRNE